MARRTLPSCLWSSDPPQSVTDAICRRVIKHPDLPHQPLPILTPTSDVLQTYPASQRPFYWHRPPLGDGGPQPNVPRHNQPPPDRGFLKTTNRWPCLPRLFRRLFAPRTTALAIALPASFISDHRRKTLTPNALPDRTWSAAVALVFLVTSRRSQSQDVPTRAGSDSRMRLEAGVGNLEWRYKAFCTNEIRPLKWNEPDKKWSGPRVKRRQLAALRVVSVPAVPSTHSGSRIQIVSLCKIGDSAGWLSFDCSGR